MTSDSAAREAHLLKFQQLLRELFQFDCADLDFGIYRIMNHKRSAVERFISDQLPSRIAAELETGHLARQSQAMADLERERKLVLENIAGDAIDADGNLDDKYSGTFRGKKYLEAQAAAAPGRGRQAVETDVYNHLYTFFSRYYQDGDFVSKRRYSRSQRYAIPYNGEEVYLHWANSDQYYVKTAEHFNNYDWTALNGVVGALPARGRRRRAGQRQGRQAFLRSAEWKNALGRRGSHSHYPLRVPSADRAGDRPLRQAETAGQDNPDGRRRDSAAAGPLTRCAGGADGSSAAATGRTSRSATWSITCGNTPGATTPTSSYTRTCAVSCPANWTST